MATTYKCPQCQAVLTLEAPMESLTCPKCKIKMVVQSESREKNLSMNCADGQDIMLSNSSASGNAGDTVSASLPILPNGGRKLKVARPIAAGVLSNIHSGKINTHTVKANAGETTSVTSLNFAGKDGVRCGKRRMPHFAGGAIPGMPGYADSVESLSSDDFYSGNGAMSVEIDKLLETARRQAKKEGELALEAAKLKADKILLDADAKGKEYIAELQQQANEQVKARALEAERDIEKQQQAKKIAIEQELLDYKKKATAKMDSELQAEQKKRLSEAEKQASEMLKKAALECQTAEIKRQKLECVSKELLELNTQNQAKIVDMQKEIALRITQLEEQQKKADLAVQEEEKVAIKLESQQKQVEIRLRSLHEKEEKIITLIRDAEKKGLNVIQVPDEKELQKLQEKLKEAEENLLLLQKESEKKLRTMQTQAERQILDYRKKQIDVNANQTKNHLIRINMMVLLWFYCLIMGMNNTGWQGVLSWFALVIITGGLAVAVYAMKKAFAVLIQKKNQAASLNKNPNKDHEMEPGGVAQNEKRCLFVKKIAEQASGSEPLINDESALNEVSDLAKKTSDLRKMSSDLLKDPSLHVLKKEESPLKKKPQATLPKVLKKPDGKDEKDKNMKLRLAMMKRKAELNQKKIGKSRSTASEKR
ncbi:MAG: hypothetical protein WCS73_02010 [Lentisphaeria bacterium]